MDFDAILYIILIVGSILLSVVKTLKKDEGARQVKKMPSRPVEVETYEEEEVRPKKRTRVSPQPEQNEEYFSYETMSERDFAKEFEEVIEENNDLITKQPANQPHLTINEEDVYKGVVWSEILKRKY